MPALSRSVCYPTGKTIAFVERRMDRRGDGGSAKGKSDGTTRSHLSPFGHRAGHPFWINALVLLVLLMSGLQIFNAHPALYLGQASEFDNPLVAMEAVRNEDGLKGITTVFGWDFDTTGVLGLAGMPCKDIRSEAFRGGRLCRAIAIYPWDGAGISSSPGCSA